MVRLTRYAVPVFVFVGLALALTVPGNAARHKSFTPVQKDAIEEIVRDYILIRPRNCGRVLNAERRDGTDRGSAQG